MLDFLQKSSNRQNFPLSKEQVPTLLHFCYCNARDLYEEAALLRDHKKYARALFLCTIAFEELAKIPIATNALFIAPECTRSWKGFWKTFNAHSHKQRVAKSYGGIMKQLDRERWKRFYAKRIPQNVPLNEIKLASLYVDCLPIRLMQAALH